MGVWERRKKANCEKKTHNKSFLAYIYEKGIGAYQIPHISIQRVVKCDFILEISGRQAWQLFTVVHRVVLYLSYWELQLLVIDDVPLHSFQFYFLLHIANLQNTVCTMYRLSYTYIAETYVFPLNVILVKLTYKINFLTWILYYCSDFVERTCSESVDISLCTWDLRELNIHVTFLRKPAIQPAMVSLHQGKHLNEFHLANHKLSQIVHVILL